MMYTASLKKIPAFTITEALIGLVVTAIIVGIVFLLFNITSERLFDFRLQNEGITDINRFSYGINKSMHESEVMNAYENGFAFAKFDGGKVSYRIDQNYVVRYENSFTDTFNIKVGKVYADTIKSASQRIWYQHLGCILSVNKEDVPFNFYKRIYAAELLKNASE